VHTYREDPKLRYILPRVSRPARYTGGEWNSVVKDWERTPVKVALAYPDVYEVGMSNLGLAILYDILNRQPHVLAERVYAPWPDMEAWMRRSGLPLFSLETRHPLRQFDILGFSLQYELTFTNVLNMLDLAGIPLLAAERDEEHPLVIAGGSCAYNPEPMADFLDLFVIGEGEEVILELVETYREWKEAGGTKEELLRRLAQIEGVYVPSFYETSYRPDGTLAAVKPLVAEARPKVRKRIVPILPPPPTRPIVPYLEIVHDRAMVEIQRGCTRGCRFCQAGMIYRPVRERPLEEILQAVEGIFQSTGYEEVALVSLSSTDYTRIEELVRELASRYQDPPTSISLPSLRLDSFSVELAEITQSGRKTGLTFAPEAGTARLREVINKGIAEEDLLRVAETAFSRGWHRIKLYFMIGLPTETLDDVAAIGGLVRKVRDIGRRYQGRRTEVAVSVATFVPKPHTPFQWVPLMEEKALRERHQLLQRAIRGRGLRLSWHDPQSTLLEAVFSRGDRRLGKVLLRAWELGARFDAWGEHFRFDLWQRAFAEAGLNPDFYARRERPLDELLPWDHIDTGVEKRFLIEEYRRALEGKPLPDCRTRCHACGVREAFDLENCPHLA